MQHSIEKIKSQKELAIQNILWAIECLKKRKKIASHDEHMVIGHIIENLEGMIRQIIADA